MPDASAAINIGNAMNTRAASTLILASFNGQTVKWSGNWKRLRAYQRSTYDRRPPTQRSAARSLVPMARCFYADQCEYGNGDAQAFRLEQLPRCDDDR